MRAGKRSANAEDVCAAGGAEAVDRLHVVADDAEPARRPRAGGDDVDLERVHVLVLVDEHVVEAPRELRAGDLHRREARQ